MKGREAENKCMVKCIVTLTMNDLSGANQVLRLPTPYCEAVIQLSAFDHV